MSEPSGKTYRPWDPQCYQQEAHSPASKLPEGDLVFFLLDTVPQLDVHRLYAPYEQETRGAPPFDPAMMVCLVLYAYSVGVFSRRKIALACERHLAFLAIVGQERPDFRTSSDFRTWHLEACKDVFVQGIRLASEAGLVQWGNVSTDGTTIQGIMATIMKLRQCQPRAWQITTSWPLQGEDIGPGGTRRVIGDNYRLICVERSSGPAPSRRGVPQWPWAKRR